MKRMIKASINYNEIDDGNTTLSKINRFIQDLSSQRREETGELVSLIWRCHKVKTVGKPNLYRITDLPNKQVSFVLDKLKEWPFIKDANGSVTLDMRHDEPVINIRLNL